MIDPRLMALFRRKLMEPGELVHCRRILYSYNQADLQDPYAVGCMIDELCYCLGAQITTQQRASAIQFVIAQRCNPQSPAHRARMWSLIHR